MAQAVSWSHFGINTCDCRQGQEIVPFPKTSSPALKPTYPSTQRKPGPLFQGVNGRVVKLATPLHLVPNSECVQLDFHSPIRLYGGT